MKVRRKQRRGEGLAELCDKPAELAAVLRYIARLRAEGAADGAEIIETRLRQLGLTD
jgi:hypothetical protein